MGKIKIFFTDVDGVLTDAGMYYSSKGEYLKKFNTRDGMGFQLLRENGILTGIITKEKSNIVKKRAKKLKVDYFFYGVQDKLMTIRELSAKINVDLSEMAYIGDDINDIELLMNVGYSACPKDAIASVKEKVNYKCKLNGGQGCVREFIDFIIDKNYIK